MSSENIIKDFEIFAEKVFDQLNCVSKTLLSAMHYSFFSGGKRIRAQFVYAIGEALAIDKSNCDKIAFAVESIHTYSLIHDDLPAMDNDTLRRGKPTCHIKFNEATAILAGDALQALAFEILQDINYSDIDKLKKINKLFAQYCGASGMVGGQQLDIEGENKKLKIEELQILHINKTAKMFRACIVLPYILSQNQNSQIEDLLVRLSDLIGLCFQIKDDILDVTKTTNELGKTSAKDIDANKSTYVSLMGLKDANKYLLDKKNEITQIITKLKNNNFSSTSLENLIDLVINRNC
ncbi:octaprenyl-diphosphate synthase [Francisella tularensis]|uniref:Geranyltranstransferase n=4 Tax=Francisella tularensis TaxID=263 RepID=A0AAI8BFV3_FRATH|nr:farnesyl diphosphate synthase [Francisella tularensis]AFX70254.1 polyprenyl synthetase [Francisella tularensis subsp. holarctica F92]AHH46066.1 geranyl diphosphate synthase/farnesyl diphosphate synthase [Francisella tularensis subsp. holarctica PHIT-FT049]EBA52219.1 geranyltranstransferase [Francisella tularensis subsp. holarctica 257]ABI82521.1 geranyltranstransferase [Francisella tularensis subsp. holarctica OSU18]ABU61055.2 polyprenyl synthetase [Francisella tularensis subsp. holarctica 